MASKAVLATLIGFLLACNCFLSCFCWQEEELELFDLVEDIGENFYDILEVPQDASTIEIRRSYRRLSLKYHPDKNSDPNALERFRTINTVAEVLKDEFKRSIYDQILVEGLPDWKQPVYYYRRARRMSIYELSLLVLVVATIAQVLIGWAQYFEKWLVLQELLERKSKRQKRGSKAHKNYSPQLEVEVMYYQQLAADSIPTCKKLLPVLIIRKLFGFTKLVYHIATRMYQEKNKTLEELQESGQTHQKRPVEASVGKGGKKGTKSRKQAKDYSQETTEKKNSSEVQKTMSDSQGTDPQEASSDPVKADTQECAPQETDQVSNVISTKSVQSSIETHSNEATKFSNNQKPATVPQAEPWTQYQQQQLEWALSQYSQEPNDQKWVLISRAVPGKSKVDCVTRYKYLVEIVRKRRAQASELAAV